MLRSDGTVGDGGKRRVQLLGREREQTAIDRLVESARDGRGGVLVVHGEPGVGKTALLDDLVEKAGSLRIVRTAGVEGEMELPFAAVQQLCAPISAFGERLPDPQRDALEVAFGLRPGPAPNPFLVALAVLGLLSEAARERPLLCVADVTRGLPQVPVSPLGHRDSRALLESVLAAPLDDQVIERLIVETGGNPLALVELPHDLASPEVAGGFGVPSAAPTPAG